jgi:hypothetical protein
MVSHARGWEIRPVPLTVAPPPRNGDAAQGRWATDAPAFAASDQAETHHGAPEPTPTLPASAAIARTMAAGVLLSAAAMLVATTLVFLVAAIRLGFAGDVRLTFEGASPILLAAATAILCAATLATPAWSWPARRPRTLALAAVVTAAWPLSGYPLPAVTLAIFALGLALARDHHTPGGRRVAGWGLAAILAVPGLAAAIASVALADTHATHQPSTSTTARQRGIDAGDGAPAPARTRKRATTHSAPAPGSAGSDDAAPAGEAEAPAKGDAGGEAAPATGAEAPTGRDSAPATQGATPGAGALAFVRDYYSALNEHRYDDAWAALSPAIQARFGGFTHWRAGYAQTLSSDPRQLTTRADGDAVIVSVRLVAHEKNCNGVQNFDVTWRLVRTSAQWTVAGLRGSVAGGSSCE